MSNHRFLDISLNASCIESAIDKNEILDIAQLSFDVGSINMKYRNDCIVIRKIYLNFILLFSEVDVSFVDKFDLNLQTNESHNYQQEAPICNDGKLKNTSTNDSVQMSNAPSLSVAEPFNLKYENNCIIRLHRDKYVNFISSFISELNISFEGELDLSWEPSKNVTSLPDVGNKKVTHPEVQLTKEVVAHSIRFNQSYNAMEGVAKLVNSTPGKICAVPDTKHNIGRAVKGLFQTEFCIECKTCGGYTATTNIETKCNTKTCRRLVSRVKSPYFVNFPLRIQLLKSINEHFDTILSYNDQMSEPSDDIRDIHDGIAFRKVKEQFPDFFVLSLAVNTDGAKVFKSSNQSIWPIQLQQNFLPPVMRYIPKNIITASIHQGTYF